MFPGILLGITFICTIIHSVIVCVLVQESFCAVVHTMYVYGYENSIFAKMHVHMNILIPVKILERILEKGSSYVYTYR